MLLQFRTRFQSAITNTIWGRRPAKRKSRVSRIGSEELESRLLLTDLDGPSMIGIAQSSIYEISEASRLFGGQADTAWAGLNSGMTAFGNTADSYSSIMQSAADVSDTVSTLQNSIYMTTFASMFTTGLSEFSVGAGSYTTTVSPSAAPGAHGGTISISGVGISGYGYLDGSALNMSLSSATEWGWVEASFVRGPSGDSSEVLYVLDAPNFSFSILGSNSPDGLNVSATTTARSENGYMEVRATHDNRSVSGPWDGMSVKAAYENESTVISGNYLVSSSSLNPTPVSTWDLHVLSNIDNGVFSFDTEKNANGTASRLSLAAQSDLFAGALIIRQENSNLAVGVAGVAKDPSGVFNGTVQAYTSAGLQSTQTLTGLTGTPLNLGSVNVTGVSFSGNFNLQRRFYLINIRPSATTIFTEGSRPTFIGTATINFDF